MQKKILIVENSLYSTGGLNSILSYTEALKCKFDFIYIFPTGSSVVEMVAEKGYKVYTLPFFEINRSLKSLEYPLRLWRNAKAVLRIIDKEGIDILHVNDVFNQVGCLAKWLRPSIKLVYHIRLLKTSYIAPMYPYFVRYVRRFADRIICVSEAVMNDIKHPEQAKVIYDPIESHENLPPWNGLLGEDLKILYLGNYTRGKGQDIGLDAFIKYQKEYPNATINFYGDDQTDASRIFKNQLICLANDAKISGNVIFNGKATTVEKLMKDYDVVLNLSESESFSLVTLESLAFGVPLIVSDCGGPREITENGSRALLVQNRNAKSAYEALKKISEDRNTYKHLAAESKVWANQKFNSGEAITSLKEIYEELLMSYSPIFGQKTGIHKREPVAKRTKSP